MFLMKLMLALEKTIQKIQFPHGRQSSVIFGIRIKKVWMGIFEYFFYVLKKNSSLIQFCESQNLISQIKKKPSSDSSHI